MSGKPGSGKSSTADRVAELLGYTRHSSGDMVRNFLAKHNITLEEYNERAAEDTGFDEKVDDELRKLREKKDVVIDSRLGFYWIPESFKVYLDLDIDIATARIYKDVVTNKSRSSVGTSGSSLNAVSKQVHERMNIEQSRFKAMYGVDPFNTRSFDLVIDTSRHDPQTVAITVFDNYKKWLESDTWTQVKTGVPFGYSFKNQY